MTIYNFNGQTCRGGKIKVKNLNFYYGSFQALRDINLDIPGLRNYRYYRPFRMREILVFTTP